MIRRIDTSIDGKRFYEGLNDEGVREWCYPSVTTKIDAVYPKDAFLIQWIREQGIGGQAIFEKAGDEGTEAHIAIDRLIAGHKVPTELMELKVKRCVQAFIDWQNEFKPEFLSSEEMLVNHELNFAGTRDLLCKLDYVKGKSVYQGIYVVDYKTSSSIHDKHRVTTAGYWLCTPPSYKAAILHLGNKTKAGWSFLEFDAPKYGEIFKHYNKTFGMEYPNAEPKIETYPEFFELLTK